MRSTIPELLARLGYAARGSVYVVLGGLAVTAAIEETSAPDTRGALSSLFFQPAGGILLGAIALGLACFALWRFAQAGLDADHLGKEPKALVRRAAFAASGIANAGLAASAAGLLTSTVKAAREGSSTVQDWTAYLLALPLGQWLTGIAGAVVIGAGVATAIKAWRCTFLREMALDADTRRWAVPMGRLGFAARAVVFTLIGLFLLLAAWSANAGEARGLSGTLRAIQELSYGWILLLVTAIGLFAFGAFQFVIAWFRHIDAPDIPDISDIADAPASADRSMREVASRLGR